MEHCWGLLSAKKDFHLPLKGIEVEVEVRDHVAAVTYVLQYKNMEKNPIEAVFVFPLPGDAAVYHFSARIGLSEVIAEVKEKKRAQEEYYNALSSGQQAFLLNESEQSPDVFSLSLGSLPPGESASIRLEYVTELAVEHDDGLRFCLPAVLNPRYQPQGGGEAQPLWVTSVPASLLPYSLSVSARVSSPRPVSKIESNCSLEPIQYLNPEQTQATVRLATGHRFDRDIELLIFYKDAHKPTAMVEAGLESVSTGSLMGDPVVMLSLYPEFPEASTTSAATCPEFLFLMDRSGSMDLGTRHGRRISNARDTLLLLLKSLPIGCYFNIYGFGTDFCHVFPKSVKYEQDTMVKAIREVEMMKADMGGTNISRALRHIYKQSCIPGHPRQLFVFTDGEVTNTREVIDLVEKNGDSHRCFTFGIGEGASSALIIGMSKQGGGHAQFITGQERMQPKAMQSLRFALQPGALDISLEWYLPEGVSVTPLSQPITTLFSGQRSLIYAQLTGESSIASEGSVKVNYRLADQPFECKLYFSLKPEKGHGGLTAHRLGARTLIRSLEQRNDGVPRREELLEEGIKKKVVELSIQSGVSSAYTAFVAVNNVSGETVQGPLLCRNVPCPGSSPFILGVSPGPFNAGNFPSGQAPSPAGSSLFSMANSPGPFSAATSGMPCSPNGQPGTPFGRKPSGQASFTFGMREPSNGHGEAVPGPLLGRNVLSSGLFSMPTSPGPFSAGNFPSGQAPSPAGSSLFSMANSPGPFSAATHCAHTLPKLITCQNACGSWTLTSTLEDVLGKSRDQLELSMPSQVNQEVWTTLLALIWLYGYKMVVRDEWHLLAMKAASWLRAQKVPHLEECVDAGNALLGCRVRKESLRL